ncbi:MAG: class III cytochrome C family protein [Burkholderiales bacterium]|nr:class III cytochrome C family protein [Burkholderiales bacterium]
MKGRWLWIVIVANLSVLVGLVFVYPQLMVSPGALAPGHAALATDCFACHTPLRGATADRCIACHALSDIGLRTTRGVAIRAGSNSGSAPLKRSFHQELTEQNCMACHSEHADPRLAQRSSKPFSHALLRVETRARCDSCHVAPNDTLHGQIKGSCGQCHTSEAWKPATFEHDKLFVLDKDHNASCATCHVANDYGKFTCYGCHEHTPAKVRRKHLEEGIRNFENCVECHRSADGEPEGRGGREGRGDQKRGKRD